MAANSRANASVFADLTFYPSDAIFALTIEYHQDSFTQKVNLGQGAYRDASGQPWTLPCVAESRRILNKRGLQHEYLPILGIPEFRRAACEMVLGREIFEEYQHQIASCQSLSGTGGLHLAGQLLRRASLASNSNQNHVYITDPTWSNHHAVFSSLGFTCHSFRYYDPVSKTLDMTSYRHMLHTAPEGSVVILHACAHNPTGCDPSPDEWREVGSIMKQRKLFPLFDAAYLGFNSGNLDQDAFAIRHFARDLGLEMAICLSFAKNMGLYGERVGCVLFLTGDETSAVKAESVLERLQRSEVSTPPAYGAKIASTVLNSAELQAMWQADLMTMSARILSMRHALYEKLVQLGAPGDWSHIIRQTGMFSFLGLSPDQVTQLKEKYHIYMAPTSRISVAGLNPSNVDYVAQSITECLKQTAVQTGDHELARL